MMATEINRMLQPWRDYAARQAAFIEKYSRHEAGCAIRRGKECDCGFFNERNALLESAPKPNSE